MHRRGRCSCAIFFVRSSASPDHTRSSASTTIAGASRPGPLAATCSCTVASSARRRPDGAWCSARRYTSGRRTVPRSPPMRASAGSECWSAPRAFSHCGRQVRTRAWCQPSRRRRSGLTDTDGWTFRLTCDTKSGDSSCARAPRPDGASRCRWQLSSRLADRMDSRGCVLASDAATNSRSHRWQRCGAFAARSMLEPKLGVAELRSFARGTPRCS